MKKFDIFNQVHATFDRFGCVAGFRHVATVDARTPEHALAIAKQVYPLTLLPMVELHREPSRLETLSRIAPVHKEFVGTKRVWR